MNHKNAHNIKCYSHSMSNYNYIDVAIDRFLLFQTTNTHILCSIQFDPFHSLESPSLCYNRTETICIGSIDRNEKRIAQNTCSFNIFA